MHARTQRRRRWRAVLAVLGLAAGCAPVGVPAQDRLHADELVDPRGLLDMAEQGDARAAFLLGTRYASGRGGTRDDSEAVRWFRRAAEEGLAEAQYNLGIMYANGRGVPRDMALAARWYRVAAEQGIAEAQFNLGTLYGTGAGVPRDEGRAAEWLHRAADAALPQAQYNLGVLYEHGRGVRLDGRAAMVWYKRAADQGYGPARRRLDTLMAKLRVNEVPPVDAAEPAPPGAAADGAAGAARAPDPAAERAGTAAAPPAPERSEPAAAGGLDWVARADPAGYTLQILSDTSAERVRRFVRRHFGEDARAGMFASDKEGVRWYSVVYGEYGSYDAAKAAVGELPPALSGNEPWVRNIGLIQESMAR